MNTRETSRLRSLHGGRTVSCLRCVYTLPLYRQLLIGRLLYVDEDLLVHSRTQLKAVLVFVFRHSAGKIEK